MDPAQPDPCNGHGMVTFKIVISAFAFPEDTLETFERGAQNLLLGRLHARGIFEVALDVEDELVQDVHRCRAHSPLLRLLPLQERVLLVQPCEIPERPEYRAEDRKGKD